MVSILNFLTKHQSGKFNGSKKKLCHFFNTKTSKLLIAKLQVPCLGHFQVVLVIMYPKKWLYDGDSLIETQKYLNHHSAFYFSYYL